MNANFGTHPNHEELRRFGNGTLDPLRHDEIERHVAECDACCEVLRHVPDDTLVGALRSGASSVPVANDAAVAVSNSAASSSGGLAALPEALRHHPRYRILKQVGAGGMGIVYKAEHRMMERHVALKVINRRLLDNPTALERFRLEVKAAARLSHPNIVTAYDADQAGDLQILVMEYVDGISIARQVEKAGPLSVRFACQFARQAAFGLQHAHEKGMVHRDIKPQNLMLTRDGRVKILDFGLARLAHERDGSLANGTAPGGTTSSEAIRADAADTASDRAGLTRDGASLGTPDYMAPEQVRNARDVDIRADIYGLGGTLYWMLAGQSPFPQGTILEKLASQVDRQPLDLTLMRSDIPESLLRVLERMLAKSPDDRFGTPAQVAEALAPFCKSASTISEPIAPPPPPATIRPRPSIGTKLSKFADRALLHRRALLVTGASALVVLSGAVAWNRWGRATRDKIDEPSSSASRPSSASNSVSPADSSATPRLLLVIPQQGVSNVEYEMVRRATEYFGGSLDVAARECSPARPAAGTSHRGTLAVDYAVDDLTPQRYSAVIFLGTTDGSTSELAANSSYANRLRSLVEGMRRNGRPVVSLGTGNGVLARLGSLKDTAAARCSTLPTSTDFESLADWKAQRVVADRGVLTGADSAATKELMQQLFDRLNASSK